VTTNVCRFTGEVREFSARLIIDRKKKTAL